MVYCGKPSRGCQNCKTRRIKCDEVRPCCTQCRKSNRTCPGYPDEFDLIFRNETAAVKRRAQRALMASKNNRAKSSTSKKQQAPKTVPKPTSASPVDSIPVDPDLTCDTSVTDSSLGSPDSLNGSYTETNITTPTVAQDKSPALLDFPMQADSKAISPISPIDFSEKYQLSLMNRVYSSNFLWGLNSPQDAYAITYFFQGHVVRTRHVDSQRGYLEVLVPLYKKASPSSLLHKATYAVSLGIMSNTEKSSLLRCEARKMYGRALKDLSLAIKDPMQATTDETLMTILLFSLCEQINPTPAAREAWASHINGAVALVKLRGRKQLQNPISRRLFNAVRANMVVGSIQQSTQIEEFPDPLGWQCDDGMELNGANRLTVLTIPLPNLRSRSQKLMSSEKTSASIMEMIEVIEEAKALDSRLEEWCNSLSDAWTAEVRKIVTEEPKDIINASFWPGPQFIYRDLNVAHIITDYRICRIFCQAIIRDLIGAMPASSHTERLQQMFTEALYISQQMVNDFCSSIPYHLGFGMENRPDCRTPQDQKSSLATGAYFIAIPLWICKSLSCIPARQRQWLVGRIIYIARRHGHIEDITYRASDCGSCAPKTHHISPVMRPNAPQIGLESYG